MGGDEGSGEYTPEPVYCPDDCDGPECDCPSRAGGACREHAWEHAAGHLHAQCDRMRRELFDARRHVCPSPEWYGQVRQLVSDTSLAAAFTGQDLAGLPACISELRAAGQYLADALRAGRALLNNAVLGDPEETGRNQWEVDCDVMDEFRAVLNGNATPTDR